MGSAHSPIGSETHRTSKVNWAILEELDYTQDQDDLDVRDVDDELRHTLRDRALMGRSLAGVAGVNHPDDGGAIGA